MLCFSIKSGHLILEILICFRENLTTSTPPGMRHTSTQQKHLEAGPGCVCSACCGLLCLLTLGCHSASWRRIHHPHRFCCTPPTTTRAPSLRPHSAARYQRRRTPPDSTTGQGEAEETQTGEGEGSVLYYTHELNHFFTTKRHTNV